MSLAAVEPALGDEDERELECGREVETIACFHCGLDVPAESQYVAHVLDAERRFCCIGCRAAAEMLEAQGLADWYRRRAVAPRTRARGLDIARSENEALAVAEIEAGFVAAKADGGASVGLLVEGLHCAACIWVIEAHLGRLAGVASVRISLPEHRVVVDFDPSRVSLRAIVLRLAEIGFAARPDRPSEAAAIEREENRAALIRLGVAGLGAMNVMSYAMGLYVGAFDGIEAGSAAFMRWMGLLVATPVVAVSGRPFFEAAWRELRVRRPGMDVPVALAIAGAYLISTYATFAGVGEVYFESICTFIFLLLVGRYLEQRIQARARSLTRSLAQARPTIARRVERDGAGPMARDGAGDGRRDGERIVPAERLVVGDLFRVRPGETIAADGLVLEGESAVEEALLSGEPWPRSVRSGAAVVAGSVNVSSPLLVEATRVGDATTLAAILRLVERAQAERSPAMRLGDRIGSVFVVVVLGVSAVNFAVWSWIDPSRAVWTTLSLLVATCPCALGLALPAVTAATTHALARAGLLVTRAGVLESLARIDRFVFDKTGTLTTGEPTLVSVVPVPVPVGEVDAARSLALARRLERDSEHPIARALRRHPESVGARRLAPESDLERVRSLPALGVEGFRAGVRYRIGRPDWALEVEEGATRAPAAMPGAARAAAVSVLLAADGRPLAWFGFEDPIRPEAASALAGLRARGMRLEMLSGDPSAGAAGVAERLGLERVVPAASPEEKVERVQALQRAGARVAVVGDGVNDGPVLRAGEVSIAMGSGCDLSRLGAGAVLLRDDLALLPRAVEAARRMRRIALQNVGFSLVYNLAVLPLAVTGSLPPWAAALGMSASSLVVVTNALRASRLEGEGAGEAGGEGGGAR